MNKSRYNNVNIYTPKIGLDTAFQSNLIKTLEKYAVDETLDSIYYAALSQLAPIESQKKILIELSNDEKKHSDITLKMIAKLDPNKKVILPTKLDNPPTNFVNALYKRVVAETNDYKKYGEMYLKLKDENFKNNFYGFRTDENRHAHLINMMLNMLP